jgi:PKHD-type hydroxylase
MRTNDWFYFIQALDKNTCKKIRKVAKNKWECGTVNKKKGITPKERITGEPQIYGVNKNKRISDVVWTNDQWVYDVIWPIMLEANERAGWKYDIRFAESMQIARYKKGGFYKFHRDGASDNLSTYNEPENKFKHGYVRKLSMGILLNDSYEGGEFQFAVYNGEKCEIHTPEVSKTGSVVVFPSGMEHRVTPVTKGIRYSLVAWFVGPPFR